MGLLDDIQDDHQQAMRRMDEIIRYIQASRQLLFQAVEFIETYRLELSVDTDAVDAWLKETKTLLVKAAFE